MSENGDAYVVGHFWEVATFGSFTLTSVGQYDVFLVKYSADGDVLWAQSGGGAQWDEGYGVAVDAADNAYITGHFYSAAGGTTFGPFTLISTGDSDVFVVKYAPSGEVLWAESDGTNQRDYSYGIAVDTIGNAYVTGSNPISQGDAFLMKYSPEGEVLWERRGGGPYEDSGYDVAVDAAGNAYVTGSFGELGGQGSSSATFGPFTLTSVGRADLFLVKYSADGGVLAARSGGGTKDDNSSGVAVDAAGTAYVTGVLRGAATVGSCTFNTGQQRAGFLARTGEPVPVTVDAAPVGAPVVIPAAGGHFYFTATLSNPSAQPQTYEAWTAVTGAAGSDLVLGPQVVTVPAGGTVSKTLRQAVPAFAPAGTYAYHVRASDASCATPVSGSFTFTKAVGERAAGPPEAGSADGWPVSGWAVSGWDEKASPEVPEASSALPGGYALSEAHPNPSGGSTRLTLELAEAQHVTAAVYDGLGRRVAVLLDGAAEAGAHALVLDGVGLPAGVYLVRVTGEAFAASRRLTLVR